MRRINWLLAVCVCVSSSYPSRVFAQTSDRGWVDVNVVSSMPAQHQQTFAFQYSLFRETASLAAVYPKFPRATGVLVGGGARILGGLGAGIQITPVKYEYIVGLGIDIPHPAIFNRFASDGDVTSSTLERTDNAIDISASYQIPTPDTWRVRVFGGPTYFAIKQDFVRDIEYAQQFNLLGLNVVDITGFEQETVDESAWGFHVGGDLAFFFSRHFGVGAGIRVNSGTLTIAREPMSEQAAEIKLGSVLFGGGLRVRF
jgi:hypothetical protein